MAGNWKMNLTHGEAVVLVQKLAAGLADKKLDTSKVEVVVLPPFTDLRSVQTCVDGDKLPIRYGAQDVSAHDSGAYTDEVDNAKATKALAAGITPIVCVGEGLEVRKAGRQVEHTLAQVDGSLAGLSADQVAGLVIAYEPVWAIGTGEVATPADAQEVCAAVRGRVAETWGEAAGQAVRIQYGGSVKAANVAGIMAEADVDGCLVGGASLDATEFGGICRFYDMPVL
jgi:triosephosphate isomerase